MFRNNENLEKSSSSKNAENEDYNLEKIIKKISTEIINKLPIQINEIKYLRRGGSSFVFSSKTNKSNKEVIIKVIKKDKNNGINEINILPKLKHNNIISVYGVLLDKEEEFIYIIMEKGYNDLREFHQKKLKRRVSTESLLNYIALQIVKGLYYLYRCNIIHCDIKPQNIVINEYLNVKILDFSESKNISKIINEEIDLKYCGTLFFMAPEVIKRQKIKVKDYHKIDLFSFGVLLYVLAFGKYPFNLYPDENNDEIIYNKIMSDWKVENIDGTNYSLHFINLLNGLLEKNIEKRMNIYDVMDNYWIKGGKILVEEKENIYNANNFLINLVTDHFQKFNNYISNNCMDLEEN